MTHDELKQLLREWYEAGREIDLKNPDSLERFYEVQRGLMEYARTLYEGGEVVPTAEGREMADKLYKNRIRREHGRR